MTFDHFSSWKWIWFSIDLPKYSNVYLLFFPLILFFRWLVHRMQCWSSESFECVIVSLKIAGSICIFSRATKKIYLTFDQDMSRISCYFRYLRFLWLQSSWILIPPPEGIREWHKTSQYRLFRMVIENEAKHFRRIFYFHLIRIKARHFFWRCTN